MNNNATVAGAAGECASSVLCKTVYILGLGFVLGFVSAQPDQAMLTAASFT